MQQRGVVRCTRQPRPMRNHTGLHMPWSIPIHRNAQVITITVESSHSRAAVRVVEEAVRTF